MKAIPRDTRTDAAGASQHIIARGIERRRFFQDESDRNNFVQRLGSILKETGTQCYAWTLIPNHFHLLLKSGSVSISQVMRRLLTGYAVSYNRRHRRSGHLFQNSYKSILCQKDRYFLELVRYLHLNPLRAGVVSSFEQNKDKWGQVIMLHELYLQAFIEEQCRLIAEQVGTSKAVNAQEKRGQVNNA